MTWGELSGTGANLLGHHMLRCRWSVGHGIRRFLLSYCPLFLFFTGLSALLLGSYCVYRSAPYGMGQEVEPVDLVTRRLLVWSPPSPSWVSPSRTPYPLLVPASWLFAGRGRCVSVRQYWKALWGGHWRRINTIHVPFLEYDRPFHKLVVISIHFKLSTEKPTVHYHTLIIPSLHFC